MLNYRIETKRSMKFVGFERAFDEANAYKDIPKFWDEIFVQYMAKLCKGKRPSSDMERVIMECHVGEYGVCVDDLGNGKFRYLIAGEYMGGDVPKGMALIELPKREWAIFDCVGPLPEALQSVNTRIYKEWLPAHPEFTLDGNSTIEWYDGENEPTDANYRSAIWIPIRRK